MTKAEKAAKIIADEIKKNMAVLEAEYGYEEMLHKCGEALSYDGYHYFYVCEGSKLVRPDKWYMTGLGLYEYYITKYSYRLAPIDARKYDNYMQKVCREAGYSEKVVEGLRYGGRQDIRRKIIESIPSFFTQEFITDSKEAYDKASTEVPADYRPAWYYNMN